MTLFAAAVRGEDEARACGSCGAPLAPDAAFCRSCGARYEAPVPPPPIAPPPPPAGNGERRHRTAIWLGVAIVVLGAGAALAILLSSGSSTTFTTVVVDSEGSTVTETITTEDTDAEEPTTVFEAPAAPLVEAGSYVQAGSFRTPAGAGSEQERLLSEGIDVEVVSSDGAQEFYPGFQVLLVGPVEGQSEEKSVVKALGRNGVPSAFARSLSPAAEIEASEAAGEWSGTLDRSSSERPNLDDSFTVTLEMDAEGNSGTLEVPSEGCSQTMQLVEVSPTTLTYEQKNSCVSGGPLRIRPTGDELMVSILPLENETLVTGSLSPR